jgi:hypothetical protein
MFGLIYLFSLCADNNYFFSAKDKKLLEWFVSKGSMG